MIALAALGGEVAVATRHRLTAQGPGGGAETSGHQIDIDEREALGDGHMLCNRTKGENHVTRMPSGNLLLQVNFQYHCTTTTDPAGRVVAGGCGKDGHYVLREKAGEPQVSLQRVGGTEIIGGQTRTIVVRHHFANGQYQYFDYQEVWLAPPARKPVPGRGSARTPAANWALRRFCNASPRSLVAIVARPP